MTRIAVSICFLATALSLHGLNGEIGLRLILAGVILCTCVAWQFRKPE